MRIGLPNVGQLMIDVEQEQRRRDTATRKEHMRLLAQVQIEGLEALQRWILATLITLNGAGIVLIVPTPKWPAESAIFFLIGIVSALISAEFRQTAAWKSISLARESMRGDDDGWVIARAKDVDWGREQDRSYARSVKHEMITKYLSLGFFVVGSASYVIAK